MAAIGRRTFLRISLTAAGGLLLVPAFTRRAWSAAADELPANPLGLYLRIDADNRIYIGARNPEIGQGVKTSLPMIIADELDADWAQVTVEQLPLGVIFTPAGRRWKWGPQGAGGSTSIPEAWEDLRQVGAQARWLMRAAAARQWDAPLTEVRTAAGFAINSDGRRASFGSLALIAAGLALPRDPLPLKTPGEYRIIGRPQRVVDAPDIVTGRARYGLDVYEAGACTAVIARCPYFDGELDHFDDSAARSIPGVRAVVAIPGPAAGAPFDANLAPGVAVIASDMWSALQGRAALQISWHRGPWSAESSQLLDAQCAQLLATKGRVVRNDGDVDQARASAARVLEARYRVPFVAHAPLEPQNAFVHVGPERVQVIAPVQQPGGAARAVAAVTGVSRELIDVEMTRVGGGFGRRLTADYVAEAALLSKLTGLPIKLQWTREDDMQHDFYRPFGHHHLIAALDGSGGIVGWTQRLASASKYYRRSDVTPEDQWTSELYRDDFPAQLVPNLRLEWHSVKSGIARGSWRAPAHTANAFVVESFIDEIAAATHRDPVALRLAMLEPGRVLDYADHGGPKWDTGRLAAVLRKVTTEIGWGKRTPRGHGVGVAAHFTFGGYAAHAIEVEVSARGDLAIRRVVTAVDVGQPVNPLGIEAQMQGATIDGLSTALNLEIRIEGGRVLTRNFNDYPLMRMADAPDVEVHIMASAAQPSGCGEMGIPTAAPALTNAIYAATGVRLRSLPIGDQLRAALKSA